MDLDIQALFSHYLKQLEGMVAQVPAGCFDKSLSDTMFSLAMNAKIASNFALRGYCPLVGVEPVSFDTSAEDKASVLTQIQATLSYLNTLSAVDSLDNQSYVSDTAGFAKLQFGQPEFLHQYILPNFFFHISMLYAIAKLNGVVLSKADYDGYHAYPAGFSFVNPAAQGG
mgnify:CR=1 FL=1